MTLSTERRQQLDDIVVKMANQNAPKEDVQLIVDDFQKKYGSEQVKQAKPRSLLEKGIEEAKGFGKSFISSARDALTQPAQIGSIIPKPIRENVLPLVNPAGKVGTDILKYGTQAAEKVGKMIPERLTTPREGQRGGFYAGEAAQLLSPTPLVKEEIGKGALGIGKKIITSMIKPTQKDIKNGFKIENIIKHDIGGNLQDILTKSTNKIKEKVSQLNSLIKSSDKNINIDDVVKELEGSIKKEGLSKFGNISSREKALNDLKKEVTKIKQQGLIPKNGKLTIPQAQEIKQSAGLHGAWNYGKPDRDSSALESIYNEFYSKIKNSIEKNSPEGIKGINKELSEIIPIQYAVIRRIPVAERNQPLSLTDVIMLSRAFTDPKEFSLFLFNKLLKSGKVGESLTKIGKKLTK